MKNLVKGLIFTLLLSISGFASAALMIGANSTVDTDQGLEFLHVGLTPTTLTSAQAQSGFSFDGTTWALATVDQLIELVSNATGLALPAWDGQIQGSSNFDDFDMSVAESDAMLAALGTPDTGPTWIDGEGFGISQFWAHTCCDDIHIRSDTWSSTARGLFVKSADVPSPGVLALMGLGLPLLAYTRRRYKLTK